MCIDQPVVNPITRTCRQLFDVDFSGCEHCADGLAVHDVTVDIDIREVIVRADFLNLAKRILQRLPIPQTHVR